jgi:hypothetical protein
VSCVSASVVELCFNPWNIYFNLFGLITIIQQLYQKAERTKTQAQQKELERWLHVIQVEAVVSIKWVNDNHLPRI